MNKTTASRLPDESVLAALSHLEQTSRLLLATSPAVSAYLGSQSNQLSSNSNYIEKRPQQDRTCHGCGSTMIPGWSCKKSRENVTTPREKGVKKHTAGVSKPSTHAKPKKPDYLAYECDRCHSTTRFNLPETKPLPVAAKIKALGTAKTSIDKTAVSLTPAGAPPVQSAPSQPSSVKGVTKPEGEVSGRKRAKKTKSGGLAALLAKSKSESAPPAAFDLMDFMKTA